MLVLCWEYMFLCCLTYSNAMSTINFCVYLPGKEAMSGKQSSGKKKGSALMAQMGMFNNMAEMEDNIYGDDDDDDLEAELLALQSEGNSPPKSPAKSMPNFFILRIAS